MINWKIPLSYMLGCLFATLNSRMQGYPTYANGPVELKMAIDTYFCTALLMLGYASYAVLSILFPTKPEE